MLLFFAPRYPAGRYNQQDGDAGAGGDGLLRPVDEGEAMKLTVDEQIDRVVYELYGLTAEEIRIVEEATG